MRAVLFFILCVTGSVIVNRFMDYLSLQKARRELVDMLQEGDFSDMSDDLWEDNEDYEENQELTISTMSWSDKDIYHWLRETYPHKDFKYFEGNIIGTDNFELYCDAFRNDAVECLSVSRVNTDIRDTEDKDIPKVEGENGVFYWNDMKTQPVAAGNVSALKQLVSDLSEQL